MNMKTKGKWKTFENVNSRELCEVKLRLKLDFNFSAFSYFLTVDDC